MNLQTYISFRLGNDEFAVNVDKVRNILEVQNITHVPKSLPHLKGVTNLRGAILPVVDTRIKMNMTDTQYTKNTCILVISTEIEGEHVETGALVDAVQEVFEFDADKLQPPPSMGIKYNTEFIKGVIHHKNQFIVSLDIDKVLNNQLAS